VPVAGIAVHGISLGTVMPGVERAICRSQARAPDSLGTARGASMATSPGVQCGSVSATKPVMSASLPRVDVLCSNPPAADSTAAPDRLRGDQARSMPTKYTGQEEEGALPYSVRSRTESYEP
jgi:hypothetical protein